MTNGPAPIYPAYCFSASPTFNKWVKLTVVDIHALRQEKGFEGQNIFFHLNHPIRYVYLIGPVVAIDNVNDHFLLLEIDDGSGATLEVKITRISPLNGRPHPRNKSKNNAQATRRHDGGSKAESGDTSDTDDELDQDDITSAKAPGATAPRPSITTTSETTIANLTITSTYGDHHVHLNNQEINIGTVLKLKGTLHVYRSTFQLTLLRAFIVYTTDEEAQAWNDYAHFCGNVLSRPWLLSDGELRAIAAAEKDKGIKAREADRLERERVRRYREKRMAWEERKRRHEDKAEKRREKETRVLDGNALDRPGWRPLSHEKNKKPLRSGVRP